MYVLHVSHEPTKRDHRFRGRCGFGCFWDHPEFPVQNGFNSKTSIPPPPTTPNKNQNRKLTEESLPLGDCW